MSRRQGARPASSPLVDGFPYLEAEVAWAAEHELALSLEDVLVRRIRLAPELRDRGAVDRPARRRDPGADPRLGPGAPGSRRSSAYLEAAHREFDVPA